MAITRHSDILDIGTSDTVILEAESGEEIVVVSLIFGNIDGSDDASVTITLEKATESDPKNIVTDLPVLATEAVEIFVGGKGSLFLEPGDILSAAANAADDVTCTVSWLSEV